MSTAQHERLALYPISLIDPAKGVLSAIAFHEKAGRSQVSSFVFSLDKVFSFPAE